MEKSIFIGLIQNIAVLLAFSMVYDYLWAKNEDIRTTPGKILTGFMLGLIGIFLMFTPWTLSPGIVFDTRSIMLAISGLFFGGIPTLIAMIITATYRIYMGGAGMWMGIAVIFSSGIIGLLWRRFFPPKKIKKPIINLLLLGLAVHLVMMLCTLLLPKESIATTLQSIWLTLLIIYTPGTMLLGLLMLKRWSVWQIQKDKEESEEKYRILVETAGEGILVTQDGYIRFANKKIVEMLKTSEEKIKRRPFIDFVHPEDREFVMKRYKSRISGKKTPTNYSFRVMVGTDTVKWVKINSVVIEWENKPATLNFIDDVTALKETERQLIIAKEKAEESNRLKSIFLANMSHEIRTPMNAIIGFSNLLGKNELSDSERKKFLHMIRTAGSSLLQIINDIIDISKLEAHQLAINPNPCKLYDIFIQSIKAYNNSPLLNEKSELKLLLSFPEAHMSLWVNIDQHRLQQIINNLLDNAIKYTPKGTIKLGCAITENMNGPILIACVKDTGPGIPEEKYDMIFERFRQVEEDHYRQGTGLGLSISKGIVELLGGKIWFEPNPDKGSIFYFSIPLDEADKPAEISVGNKTVMPDFSGKHILIAEDDMASFYLLKEFLRDVNAEISYAEDGEKLMDMLKDHNSDILLLDINLPKKDGYACLEEIKAKGYKTKIIAQTAYAMRNEKEHFLELGCKGYISKPIDQEELFREISKVLKDK